MEVMRNARVMLEALLSEIQDCESEIDDVRPEDET